VTGAGAPVTAWALWAAGQGWQLFPLRPNDKRPAVRDWQTRATTDLRRVRRCWSGTAYNVGIACGPSRLVVIDLDVHKSADYPPPRWRGGVVTHGLQVLNDLAAAGEPADLRTFTVATGSGGRHLYFRAPSGDPLRNTAGRLGPLIDTRADGGYVVAPGSVVADRPYRIIDSAPVADLPRWVIEGLRRPKRSVRLPAPVSITAHSPYAEAALRREINRVLAAPPGRRNHTLNAAAFGIGQLVAADLLDQRAATNGLRGAGAAAGLSEHECATVRSGLTAGARTPRHLPT